MAGADTDVGDDIDRAQRRAALLTALAELTASERELVSLRYGAELNATEIAVLVGKDAANVRKLLERVRTRLGERIETLLRLRGAQ
jgi:RNA polymerase sigma factor (sigma-70 family)